MTAGALVALGPPSPAAAQVKTPWPPCPYTASINNGTTLATATRYNELGYDIKLELRYTYPIRCVWPKITVTPRKDSKPSHRIGHIWLNSKAHDNGRAIMLWTEVRGDPRGQVITYPGMSLSDKDTTARACGGLVGGPPPLCTDPWK